MVSDGSVGKLKEGGRYEKRGKNKNSPQIAIAI